MTEVYIVVAIAEIVIACLPLVRLVVGPTASDRVIAVNTLTTQAMLSVLFFAAAAGRSGYLDVALWLASVSYLGTILWARFLEGGLL